MDTKAILRGIEEVRRYLLGEVPMLVGGVDDEIADLKPTYFTGKMPPEAEIWKLLEYVQANPERFEMELEQHYQELARAHRERWRG